MKRKTFDEINSIYDLEIKRIVETIKSEKAKIILLQFPEGMKPHSMVIADEIEKQTNCNCLIWLSSCFGACDLPLGIDNTKIDLVIQFGHSNWNYSQDQNIKVL